MEEVAIIGIDVAKHSFRPHGSRTDEAAAF